MTLILAATSAALAVWLLVPARIRPGRGGTQPRGAGQGGSAAGLARRVAPLAGLGAVAAPLLPSLRPEPHLLLVAATGGAAAWAGVVLLRRSRSRVRRERRRREVVGLCDGLVAELRSGQPPARALGWVAVGWPELERAGALARMGGDVPGVMRRLARDPGAEPFAHLAAGWQVAQRTGAGLADVLERLTSTLRDDEEVRHEVAAALGPTRATGRLLAALPLFGLGLGMAMGADPVSVLFGSAVGAGCLALGAGSALIGLFWVERIVDRADPW